MTTMITEVYEAFKEANVSDAKAIAAATAIPTKDNLATKEDLLMVRTELKDEINNVRQDILRLENKIIVWMGSMFVVAVSILATLMKVL